MPKKKATRKAPTRKPAIIDKPAGKITAKKPKAKRKKKAGKRAR